MLRQLKAHQRPVHVARFSPDKLHVLSGSDDATVQTALAPDSAGPFLPCPALTGLRTPNETAADKHTHTCGSA